MAAARAETGRSKLLVERRRRQHQCLVRHIDGWLPLLLLLEGHPTVVRLSEHVVIIVAASAHFVVFVDAVALDKEVFPGVSVAVVLEVRLLDGLCLLATNVSGRVQSVLVCVWVCHHDFSLRCMLLIALVKNKKSEIIKASVSWRV